MLFCVLAGCRNDESAIPECEVYVKTKVSEYEELRTANHAVLYPRDKVYPANFRLGFGGIVLFRSLEGVICCCDLACPYEVLRTTTLSVQMPYATCSECGSKFDLTYGVGNPIAGPAKTPLKRYNKIRDTGEYVMVSN